MRLRHVIFGVYVLSSAVGFAVLMAIMLWEVRPRYVESTRRTMEESARLLAVMLEVRLRAHPDLPVNESGLAAPSVATVWAAELAGLQKVSGQLRVYVTDGRGQVIGDSASGRDIGKDYTRRPEMAAYFESVSRGDRNTDLVDGELRVTAPVVIGGRTIALVGVGRKLSTLQQFIFQARLRLGLEALAVAGFMVLTGWWIANRVAQSIEKLTHYAREARTNAKVRPPSSMAEEIRQLGEAFEALRVELEGKNYVEQYTQSLAHEIKSPLSGIRGAAELLAENPPVEDRDRFLANLRSETERLRQVVDKLLELAAVEARRGRHENAAVDLKGLVEGLVSSASSSSSAEGRHVHLEADAGVIVEGEPFLLRQAVDNLLQNALEFSPSPGKIGMRLSSSGRHAVLTVEDEGPGIPEYALGRVFERFYSLARPRTGRKSTGLGLNFVREVALLHGGEVTLENRAEGGARATLRLLLYRKAT